MVSIKGNVGMVEQDVSLLCYMSINRSDFICIAHIHKSLRQNNTVNLNNSLSLFY